MIDTPSVASLKAVLEDVEPAVIRRLITPFNLRMDRLHQVLQVALGWTNSHLWELRAGDTGWGDPIPTGALMVLSMPARRPFVR
jgi:hypothetical protein